MSDSTTNYYGCFLVCVTICHVFPVPTPTTPTSRFCWGKGVTSPSTHLRVETSSVDEHSCIPVQTVLPNHFHGGRCAVDPLIAARALVVGWCLHVIVAWLLAVGCCLVACRWLLLGCLPLVVAWLLAVGCCLVACRWLLLGCFTCQQEAMWISGTDLLTPLHVLPYWQTSCESNLPSHPVTVY